jgi:hypothetical protein
VYGIVSLNTAITDPGSPGSSLQYDLMSTVEHEIDEILGLGSSLVNTSSSSATVNFQNNDPEPEDLFRYTAPGQLAGTVNCGSPVSAYFSYTGTGVLSYFNTACNGADFGDWAPGTLAQVQDAFATPGGQPLYGPNEIAALSAIGYTVAAPEPGTWVLLSLSVPAFVLGRRRLQRALM